MIPHVQPMAKACSTASLGFADSVIAMRAEERGSSWDLVARLNAGAKESFDGAADIAQRWKARQQVRQVSQLFLLSLFVQAKLHGAKALGAFARTLHAAEEIGRALAAATSARTQLAMCKEASRERREWKEAFEAIRRDIESLTDRLQCENDAVYHHPVPSDRSSWPSATRLASPAAPPW